MSLLGRAPLRTSQVFRTRITAPSRCVHGHYHHLPFKLPGQKKGIFAVKVFGFLAFGFSIPFIASAYQLKKAAGGA